MPKLATHQEPSPKVQDGPTSTVEATLEALAVPVIIVGSDNHLDFANSAWAELTGSIERVDGNWTKLLRDEDRDRLLKALAGQRSGVVECRLWEHERIRRTRWLWRTPTARGARIVTILDITASREREEELSRLAARDPLTGAANRRAFMASVDEALRGPARPLVGIVYADLNRFKEINDSFGHWMGDRVLKLVADRMQQHLRAGDLLGRIGGDEFAVLCHGSAEDVMSVAQRLVAALADPLSVNGNLTTVGVSVGVALVDDLDRDGETLLLRADRAMYDAKRHAEHHRAVSGVSGPGPNEAEALSATTVEGVARHLHAATELLGRIDNTEDGAATTRRHLVAAEIDRALAELAAVEILPPTDFPADDAEEGRGPDTEVAT